MKFSNLVFAVSALLFATKLTAQQTDSCRIEVTVQGIAAGPVKLVGTYGDQNYIADTTSCDANGHFVLRRKNTLPAGFYTFLLPGQKNFSFLMDTEQFFSMKLNINDIVGTMQIENCLNTELLYRNFRFQSKQDPEYARLGNQLKMLPENTEEYKQTKELQSKILADRKAHLEEIYSTYPNAFFTKFKRAGQNPELVDYRKPDGKLDTLRQLIDYRSKFWETVDFNDVRLLHTPVIGNKLRRYIKELTPQLPDSIIKVADALTRKVIPYHREYFKFFANWIGLEYENGKTTVMDGEAVYVHMIKNFCTPELAFWSDKKEIDALQKKVWEMEASLMGRKGPDVRAQDVNGQMKSIYEMTAPLVVVFMFSPDCEHCQKEAPEVQKIYEKWKSRGVDFYGISMKTTDEEWKKFVRQNGFTFTNVYDPTNRAIYAKYYVDITPELYVLNKDRIIVAKNLKASQLEEIFARELKKMGM